jgi:hypothetical protein
VKSLISQKVEMKLLLAELLVVRRQKKKEDLLSSSLWSSLSLPLSSELVSVFTST